MSITRPRSTRYGGIKRTLLIVLIVVVVLIVLGVLAAPTLLSGAVGGIIERSVNKGIEGRVEARDVRVSWGGPQRIGSLILQDPSGAAVANVSASVETGLLALALGSRDLGLIRIEGELDVRQRADGSLNVAEALAPKPGGPVVVKPGAAPTPKPGTPGEPIRVPKGLAFDIDVTGLELTYTPADAAIGPIGFKTTKGAGRFAAGQPVNLDIEAQTLDGRRALTLGFNADRLTDADGVLALRDAAIELNIDGALPADYADALGRILAPEGSGNATVGPAPDGGFTARLAIASRDGRLVLDDSAGPAIITGRIPGGLVRLLSTGDAAVHVETPPRITGAIYQLDLPLPESGSLFDADWRDAIIVAAVGVDAVRGTIALQGEAPKSFDVEPFELRLQPLDRLFDLVAMTNIKATFDNMKAGSIDVDFRMAGLLNENGRPKLGEFALRGEGYTLIPGPEYLRAQIIVHDFPTALLEPLVERTGVSLVGITGPTLEILARSGVRQGTSDLPTEVTMGESETLGLPQVGQPYLAITLASERTAAWIDLILDADRLKTRNKGIKIETDAAGDLLRALAPSDGPRFTGQGMAFIELSEVDIPLIPGGGLDLRAASGNYRVVAGRLGVEMGADVSPLMVDSIDIETTLRPGSTPTWGLDARALFEGEKFAFVGRGELLGAFAPAGGADDAMGLSPSTIRPTGSIQIIDVPTRVASLVSAQAGRIAEAAAGRTIKGTVESTMISGSGAGGQGGAGGAIRVVTALESDGAITQGGFSLDAGRVSFDDTGLSLTLLQPGRLLTALADTGASQPPLVFDDAGQATLTISDTSIDLSELAGGAPLTGVAANARLDASGLSGRVVTDGRTARLALDSVKAGLSLDPAGDMAISLDSTGRVDDAATTTSGTLRVVGARGTDGAIDLGRARIDGSWQAKNVPTSILALVSPEQAEIVRRTVGDSIDVSLLPDESGQGAGRGAWRVAAVGSAFEMVSRLGLEEQSLRVGPTRVSASLTPRAVDAALSAYAPDLSPRPRLVREAPLELDSAAFSIPLKDGYRPDLSAGVAISGRLASGGDIVLADLPGVEKGQTSSLGLRAFAISAKPSAGATAITLEPTTLFDPASNRTAATLSGGATFPADPLSATLRAEAKDTSALDAMLATEGLIREMVGDSLTLDIQAIAPEPGATAPVVASVSSPRLKANAELARSDSGITLTRPGSVDWLLSKKAAERLLFAGKDGAAPALTVENDVRLNVDLTELRLGSGTTGLLARDTFRLQSNVRIGELTFIEPGKGERASLPASAGRVAVDPATGALVFDLDEARADGGAPAPGATAGAGTGARAGALAVDARLVNFADASGAPAFDKAHLTSTIRGTLPAALVDVLASMDGMLEALVGPTVAANIQTVDLSRADTTGTVSADIDAPYADFTIKGRLEPGPDGPVLAATAPMEARIFRITNETSERMLGVLFPLLTRFEKTAEDEPGVVTATGLTIPLDGRTQSLNGKFVVHPGTLQFETKSFFAKLLSATSNRSVGSLGGKLKPFNVDVVRGVATYKDAIIPAGEFDIETYGTVDLNKRKMDIYALVPFHAIQNDLAATAKRIPGVSELTKIPIRSKGSFDNPEIGIDFEELVRRVPQNLGGGVGDILDKTLGDLLNKDKKDSEKKDGDKKKDGKKNKDGG